MSNAPLLSVQNLAASYGSHQVLRDVSFTVSAGSVVGFVGGNGTGKTTALKIVAGLNQADSGRVLFSGTPLADHAEPSSLASFCIAPDALYPHFSVEETLYQHALLLGLPRTAIESVLTEIDRTHAQKRPTRALSQGMRLRLGIMLLHDAPLMCSTNRATALTLLLRNGSTGLFGGVQKLVAPCSSRCTCSLSLMPFAAPSCSCRTALRAQRNAQPHPLNYPRSWCALRVKVTRSWRALAEREYECTSGADSSLHAHAESVNIFDVAVAIGTQLGSIPAAQGKSLTELYRSLNARQRD